MSDNALTIYEGDRFSVMQRTAKSLVESGYFSDTRNIAQAVVKVMAGAELGLAPFASMTGIHVIQGKPVLGANVIATLIKNDSRYDYQVRQMDNNAVVIAFFENGNHVGDSSFSIDDAKAAGVTGKDTWRKFPRNMLFARAISNGARWFTPGIFGGSPVYTPDEMGADVDEEGYIVSSPIASSNGSAQTAEPGTWEHVTESAAYEDDEEPPSDDEVVIQETSARQFFPTCAALLGQDEEALKERFRSLGYRKIPGNVVERLAAYRALKADAVSEEE